MPANPATARAVDLSLGRALSASADGIMVVDPHGRVDWTNDAGRATLRQAGREADGNWLGLWDGTDRQAAEAALRKAATGTPARFRGWSPAEAAGRQWWDVAVSPLRDEDGRIEAILVTARDLTPEGRAERELRDRVRQLNAIIANEPECVKVVGADGALLEMNPAGLAMLEAETLEQARRQPLIDYVVPRYRAEFTRLHRRVLGGENVRMQFQITGLRGTTRWLETHATPLRDADGAVQGLVGVTRDITAHRSLQEQACHAQRLEGIGMLAAGIAHDLNNVLAPIMMAAPMLADHVAEPGGQQILGIMKQSAERGAGLVRQILAFAHQADEKNQVVDLGDLIRDIGSVVRETFPKNIAFVEDVAADLPRIEGNPVQVQQVLLNLCVNARDALPNGGTIALRAGRRVLDRAQAARLPDGRAGAFAVIRVEDSGTGIPPEIIARIWEPFYTTKRPGKGTGLGLPTVRGIVERHHGFITLDSVVGRGSCFSVWLPVVEEQPTAEPARSWAGPADGGGERILVVDDEASIRDLASASLRRHGYEVTTASGAKEAEQILGDRSRMVDLLITDLHMADGDGWALANHARQAQPDIRLLVMSGASGDPPSHIGIAVRDIGFIPKPFSIEQLWKRVDRLFSNSAAGDRQRAEAGSAEAGV